ncbi:helix-turn-helix domain-containing protein [Aquimarina macrocephali]|uniref:helix-turn-helix domain-containing protein n=1 Tax=Aquimarina macrocephali TaxID=666563 RepID=UPI003F67A1F2
MNRNKIKIVERLKKKGLITRGGLNELMILATEENEKKHSNILISTLSIQKTKQILNALEKFENNKDCLRPNITLANLASKLNTNSKYLSKTINLHKKKSFTQYINDQRIEYLIEKLKTDKIYTNYTIKAISKEIGFNTPKAFSQAFFKKTGVYPSEYIKNIIS